MSAKLVAVDPELVIPNDHGRFANVNAALEYRR